MIRAIQSSLGIALLTSIAVASGCAQGGGASSGRGGTPDAALDSRVPPGPLPDALPTGCTVDGECNDGVSCNGVESCVGGACRPGTPVNCDDGISCTLDNCNEPSGTCTHTADDSRCSGGQRCDGSRGCIATCSESPCRLMAPQCGCEAGEGCYLDAMDMRGCQPAGTSRALQSCAGLTECLPGLLCLNYSRPSETPVGACAQFCGSDSDCPGDGALCLIELQDSAMRMIPGATVCTNHCNPVDQTGCPPATYCDVFQERDGAMRLFTHCTAPAGSGGQGSSCSATAPCSAGYACIDHDADPGTSSLCLKWCRSLIGSSCPLGTVCSDFTPPLRVGTATYGVCF